VLYAGPARNSREVEQAVTLASRVFARVDENHEQATERKSLLVCEHPGAGKDSVVVVSSAGNKVIGAAFLIDRVLPRSSDLINGTFISSICIDENVRGQGYSVALMDAALCACTKRGTAIALIVARRAVDHFYTRFGFWGISQYSKLSVNTTALSGIPTSGLLLRTAASEDLLACAALYNTTYKSLFGHCLRDSQTWHHLLKKTKYLHVHLSVFRKAESVMGYAMHDDEGNVYELCTVDTDENLAVLALLASQSKVPLLQLHVSPAHPVISAMDGLDLTLSIRECPFGGHMARVIDTAQLMTAAKRRIEQRARTLDLGPRVESADGFHAVWDGQSAHLRLDKPIDNLARTARLLGVDQVTSQEATSLLDPPISFNIPLGDQV